MYGTLRGALAGRKIAFDRDTFTSRMSAARWGDKIPHVAESEREGDSIRAQADEEANSIRNTANEEASAIRAAAQVDDLARWSRPCDRDVGSSRPPEPAGIGGRARLERVK